MAGCNQLATCTVIKSKHAELFCCTLTIRPFLDMLQDCVITETAHTCPAITAVETTALEAPMAACPCLLCQTVDLVHQKALAMIHLALAVLDQSLFLSSWFSWVGTTTACQTCSSTVRLWLYLLLPPTWSKGKWRLIDMCYGQVFMDKFSWTCTLYAAVSP